VAWQGGWEALVSVFGEDARAGMAWWYGLVRRGCLENARVKDVKVMLGRVGVDVDKKADFFKTKQGGASKGAVSKINPKLKGNKFTSINKHTNGQTGRKFEGKKRIGITQRRLHRHMPTIITRANARARDKRGESMACERASVGQITEGEGGDRHAAGDDPTHKQIIIPMQHNGG